MTDGELVRLPPSRARRGCRRFCRAVLHGLIPILAVSCHPPDRDPGDAAAGSVVDDVGHVHALHPPRTRIVSLIPAATETLVEMGVADRLIARTRYDEQEELAALPILSGVLEPGVEALADLAPDLLIMWPTGGDGGPIGDQLVRIGLHWYGAAINTVADFERHTANLGQLLGLEECAESVVAAVRRELVVASESWPGREPAEIFYVVQEEPPMTVGAGTFLDSIFAAAGAVNSFRDVEGNWPSISLEQIIWRDPDYVVVPVEGYGAPPVVAGARDPSVERMADLFGWSSVPAVAAGRVISVDASLFGRPGPRMGEAARYLAGRIHGSGRAGPGAVQPSAGSRDQAGSVADSSRANPCGRPQRVSGN